MLFRRRRALVCRQAVAMVTDYLDDALSARDRARLEAHLAGCPHCTTYFEQIRQTIEVAGRVAPDDLSADALDDLVALYRSWRRDDL